MKKMIAFLFGFVILFSISFFKNNNFDFLNCFDKLVIVTKIPFLNKDYQVNGNQYYYTLTKNDSEILLKDKHIDNIDGYVFYFDKNFDLNSFKVHVDFSYEQNTQIDNYDIYYGYFSGYNDFRFVNNKKINFQLAYNGENWILGFPMILTGF